MTSFPAPEFSVFAESVSEGSSRWLRNIYAGDDGVVSLQLAQSFSPHLRDQDRWTLVTSFSEGLSGGPGSIERFREAEAYEQLLALTKPNVPRRQQAGLDRLLAALLSTWVTDRTTVPARRGTLMVNSRRVECSIVTWAGCFAVIPLSSSANWITITSAVPGEIVLVDLTQRDQEDLEIWPQVVVPDCLDNSLAKKFAATQVHETAHYWPITQDYEQLLRSL